MTTFTLITDDSTLTVDGETLTTDLSSLLLGDIHALGFDGSVGEIEYKDKKKANHKFSDPTPYSYILSFFALEKKKKAQSLLDEIATLPTKSYKDKRAKAYAALYPENSVAVVLGHTVDALFKAHYGDTTDLDALALKINKIKQEIPKE